MEIKRKRVISLKPYLGFLAPKTKLIIGLKRVDYFRPVLRKAGFVENLRIGDAILPSADMGPVSFFNAEGKYVPLKDQPLETAYRQVNWKWQEWRGRYDSVEMSKIVDVPYQRYPREFIPPPSLEFNVTASTDGKRVIATRPFVFTKKNEPIIIHAINLFLEMFGECTIYTENLDEIFRPPVRRLNWTVLPEGEMPWRKLEREVRPIIKKAPRGNRIVIETRFRLINGYSPEFVAIGKAGFNGYIVFAFPAKDAFVLESIYPDNATYVFGDNWEKLSRMTKAEVLNDELQKDRLIHREGWEEEIKSLLM